MRYTNLTILIIVLLLSSGSLRGQSPAFSNKIGAEAERAPSPAALERAAARAANESDHYAAMKFYERFLAADSSETVLQSYGEEALSFSALENAETAYQSLVDRNGENATAEHLFRLAEIKFHLGKYSEAQKLFQAVLLKPGISADMAERAQTNLEDCEWAADVLKNSDLEITLENMGEAVNSPFSDFAPYQKGDTLYYTSWRFPFENDKHKPARNLMRVLAQTPGAAATEVNFNEPNRHTAHTAFNRAGNLMFLTNGDFVNAASIRSEIFMRARSADGTWGTAIRLPETINLPGYTATQPAVGWDKTGQEVLFFVSDRPGGKGKQDIWYSLILADGGFSEPLNLATLNTPGNDITPFYHSPTETLYFSSDGYQTLGGYDIYKTKGKGLLWATPEHLGHPTNSNLHDLYYSLTPNSQTAYFASNRKGAQYLTEEACCLDIFKLDLKKPEALVVTFNRETGDSLNGTQVRLIETSGTNEEIKLNVPGNHSNIPVRLRKSYLLIASKDGFDSDTLTFDSPEKAWAEVFKKHLYLRPRRLALIAKVFDYRTRQPIVGATCRFLELSYLTSHGAVVKGKGGGPLTTDIQSNAAGNRYDYRLDFDRKYRVIITKPGYSVDSVDVTTEGMVNSGVIEKNLYLNRGLALEARAFDAATQLPLLGTQIRFIELDNQIAQTGTNLTGHRYSYGLDFERKYRVVITREGYYPDSVDFTTTGLRPIDFQTITKDLYLRPLKLVSFLPVKLYFDNDEPDKRTLRTTTTRTYGESYFDFYPLKSMFVNQYLAGGGTAADEAQLDEFFEKEVKGGWNKLLLFSKTLQNRLETGEKITITITGFASPRAKSNYNRAIAGRRISSVKNHFLTYENGALVKYIRTGQLTIREEPNGEDKAPPGISDQIPDTRNSVFSVAASRERRVEITEVIIER
ncbi:MAG: hypothetical protein ACK4Q5_19700 [Saprospiraceae bacterium]